MVRIKRVGAPRTLISLVTSSTSSTSPFPILALDSKYTFWTLKNFESQKRNYSQGFGEDTMFDFTNFEGRAGEHRYKLDGILSFKPFYSLHLKVTLGYSGEAFRIFDKKTQQHVIHKGSLIITPQKYYLWRPRSWIQFNVIIFCFNSLLE
jgi:hypothetical protein